MAEISIAVMENIANTALDHYFRGPALAQTLVDRPTLQAFRDKQGTFPGGKESIRGNVKGDYTTEFMGYSFDDEVTYANPTNIKQFDYPWFELHSGIEISHSELKHNGILVGDTTFGENANELSDDDSMRITNVLQDKLDDMVEGSMRSMNSMLWDDGLQSPKVFPGILAMLTMDPTTGIVGGIDGALNSWWRNVALVGANKITYSTTTFALLTAVRENLRLITKFGGKPTMWRAGHNAISRLEREKYARGQDTLTGFNSKDATTFGPMAPLYIRGMGEVIYEPELDNKGYSDFIFGIDPRHLQMMVMKGDDMRRHSPPRPAKQYVLYRGMTWTGCIICKKRNSHIIIETAGSL